MAVANGNNRSALVDLCILIPCYNDSGGLIESVNSIVYHRGRFVVLIVDDGSDDPISPAGLYQHIPMAVSLRVIRLQQNLGITGALNKGLEEIYTNCPARFIARLDCGDICSPERFFRQVAFMETNTSIDLLGTWCYFKDKKTGSAYGYTTPATHRLIKRSMHFRNVFIHPTVMWRASVPEWRYPENYPHAEDYGLFYDIMSKKTTAILEEFLVICMINERGISIMNRRKQLQSRLKIIWSYGNSKWWVGAGTIKLLILMLMPYRSVYQIKKWMYKRSC